MTQHDWGQDVPSLTYSLSSSYTLIDEGDEPYSPPDENAEKWGVRARFFLGALFLVPVAYLGILQYRTKKRLKICFRNQNNLRGSRNKWIQVKERHNHLERAPKHSIAKTSLLKVMLEETSHVFLRKRYDTTGTELKSEAESQHLAINLL